MTNPIKIKRSSVANKIPQPGDLDYGELAINYTDGNLFFKDSNNTVQTLVSTQFVSVAGNITGNVVSGNVFVGNGAGLTGVTANIAVTVSNTAPGFPSTGDIWIDSSSGIQYLYFNDGDSSQWVETQASLSISNAVDIDFQAFDQDIIPTANITYDLGNATNRFADIYANNVIAGELVSPTITAITSNVSTLQGNVNVIEGNIGNIETDITTVSGNVTSLQADVANLNFYNDANVAAYLPTHSGNITAGNISVSGTITGYATTSYVDSELANLVASAPSALDTLNELANALGNDASFSTTITTSIGNNTSNITVLQGTVSNIESDVSAVQSNITVLQGNVANIESDLTAVVSNVTTLQQDVANVNFYDDANVASYLASYTGNLAAGNAVITANITAGNVLASAFYFANGAAFVSYDDANVASYLPTHSGNLAAGNLAISAAASVTGLLSVSNIAATGGLAAATYLSAAGNVTGGNLVTSGSVSSAGNIVAGTGNIAGGNVLAGSQISATGNITGANVITGGAVAATGNLSGANILAAGIVSATGNITGGNVTVSGRVSAVSSTVTGNADSGNLNSSGQVSATGNITGGNVYSGNEISAAGNVTGAYIIGDGSLLTGLTPALSVTEIDEFSNISNSIASVSTLRFDSFSGFAVDDLGNGVAKIRMNSTFKTITISGQSNLVAEGLDTLEIVAGNNISLTTNALSDPQQLTITGTYDDANVTSVLSGNVTIGNLSVTGAVLGYATTGYVDSELANLVNSAPAALDTLNELAAALGNDANFSSTVTSSIGNVAANVTILQGNVANLNYYDDANVAAYLPTYSGNITAGNILTDNYRYANGDPFVSGGGATVTVGNVAPSSPSSGDFWINTDVMKQLVYVDDGDTSQWVDIMAATSLEINAYDDANVAAYLPTYTGNITAGNILTDNYYYANGDPFVSSNYGDANVAAYLPTYSGNITAGNISVSGTITGYATTSYVDSELANLVNSAPAGLDTLGELATAIGNDASFSTTVTASIGAVASNVTILQGNVTTLEGNIAGLQADLANVNYYDDANVAAYLPTYSGNITAGNISVSGTITGYATTSYVDSELANLVASAPAALDTLNELAAALGNDANFSSTVTSSIGNVAANVTILQGNVTTLTAGLANVNYYDDANVAAYLPTYTGNITAGNILTDNFRYANGDPFVSSNYGDANVAAYLPTHTGNISAGNITNSGTLSVTGNVTVGNVLATGFFYANGDPFVSGGGATGTVANTAPVSPSAGDLWIDSDSGREYTYINDGDSNQWVELATPATEVGTDRSSQAIFTMPTAITGNLVIDSGVNGLSVGPISQAANTVITINAGQRWIIL